jgi:hypothetical protein
VLALCDEGGGSVVDEHIDRRFRKEPIHHGIDSTTVADVASGDADRDAEIAAHGGRGLLQQFEPAAADDQLAAKLGKAPAHRRAKPGAAAGDEDALPLEQAFFKHCFIPPDAARPSGACILCGL